MQTLPDLYHVPPIEQPGECGFVSFVRDIVRTVRAYAGPVARPVTVLGLTSADQGDDSPGRWAIAYVTMAGGSYVTFTARPSSGSDDVWFVAVNGHFVGSYRSSHRALRERLAAAAARGLAHSIATPPPWPTTSPD